jgi:hypothetical protein
LLTWNPSTVTVACSLGTHPPLLSLASLASLGTQPHQFSAFDLALVETVKMLFDQGVTIMDLYAVDKTQALIFYGTYIAM